MRIAISAILLVQAWNWAGSLPELFGSRGVMQWMDAPLNPGIPRIDWFTAAAEKLGLQEHLTLQAVFLVYVTSLACLLVGWRTRSAAIAAWFLQMTFRHTAAATAYGADSFAHIALFYCTWMPVGAAWSLDRSAGREDGRPTAWARLSIRTVQIHLCLMYFIAGIEKAAGWDWWNGEALWCALMRRDLCPFDMSWIAQFPLLPLLLGWGTLAIEILYPAMVWPLRTRRLWAIATIKLHIGIAIFMGLISFSALMLCLTGTMFLISAEPGVPRAERTWAGLLRWLLGTETQVRPLVG